MAKTKSRTRAAGKVKHIAFTLYLVKDMRRARKFYEGALGLVLTKNFKDQWIEYHFGNGCFAIATIGEEAAPNASSGQIAFEVDNVDAVVDRLRAHGAVVKMEPTSGSVCRMADLIDPEGNAFMIHAKHRGGRNAPGESPSRLIDARIKELGDWRGRTLAQVRALIKDADPEVVEEWKWRGVPVWSHDGIICTGETYKSVVKLTFMKGASLEDPAGLFNSSLEGDARRAIDLHEGDAMNKAAFKKLIRAAAAFNSEPRGKRRA